MPRHAPLITARPEEIRVLRTLKESPQTPQGVAARASMVLESIEGRLIKEVAQRHGVNVLTASKWRQRFFPAESPDCRISLVPESRANIRRSSGSTSSLLWNWLHLKDRLHGMDLQ